MQKKNAWLVQSHLARKKKICACKRFAVSHPHCLFHRHIFLFDLAVIVCKRKGDNYEMKEIIDLQQYKIANNPTTDKENKKVTSGGGGNV